MSTLFVTTANTLPFETDTLGALVPKRPVVAAPKFGEWLKLQRGDRSLEQIAQRVRRYVEGVGLKVNRSVIQRFERGRVPNWPMLAAFAKVYNVPIEEMTNRLLFTLEFTGANDLIGHTGTGQRPHHEGGADVPASAREQIAELERRIKAYETQLSEVQDVAGRLVKLAALGSREEREAARAERQGRRRHRKAG